MFLRSLRPHRALTAQAISFGSAAAAAVVVGLASPAWLHGTMRVVAAYDAGAAVLLLWYWLVALRTDADTVAQDAGAEDPGRNALFVLTLASIAFGFAAAITILGHGPGRAVPHHAAYAYVLGLGAVVLGWNLIHTTFLFRYARLYYGDRDKNEIPDRGLQFPGTDRPNDFDFAYFSYVVGMTFQVSDVQVTGQGIRRVVLAHGIISFAYNTAILALGVNLVSNLLH